MKEISIGFGELYPDGQHNFVVMDPRTQYPEVEVVFTTAIKPTTENLKKYLLIMAYKNKHSLTMICHLIQKNLQLLLKKNDFNTTDCDCDCDLLSTLSSPRPDVQNKTRKLLDLFEHFDMQNIVDEPTRLTPQKETLIDLIVTTRPELKTKGVLPLGISDHCLIYASLKLRKGRPPPRIITIINFKHFNAKDFQTDLSCAPFCSMLNLQYKLFSTTDSGKLVH